MKFTLSWLKTHLETDADLTTITKKLTALGLEVEGLHRLRLLRRLAPQVEKLYLWANGDRGTTFWVADLGCARVTFGLSSAISQTFPGDGEALRSPRRVVCRRWMH